MKKEKQWGFSTKLIHSGEEPDKETGAVAPILVRSKTFEQKGLDLESKFEYSRGNNPTRNKLEEKLAALEGDEEALATVFSSGVAATANLLFTLSPGDHILCCQELYGGTFRLLDQVLSKFGIEFDLVNFEDEKIIRENIKTNTRYLFVETPTNPSLHVIDLSLVSKISKETNIPFIVDATFSPPCTLKSFEFGAETVIHSLSKYIAGHNDVIGGAIITKNKELHDKLVLFQRTLGSILSPDECYRVLQGVKTLNLRWERVSKNALEVAKFLENSSVVKKVNYPGLNSHKNHVISSKQNKNGYGAVISFILKDDSKQNLQNFVASIKKNSPIIYGESLASPETIIAYPPLMSHKSLPKHIRNSLDITDGFFRLSVGFEDPKDIIEGLDTALRCIR